MPTLAIKKVGGGYSAVSPEAIASMIYGLADDREPYPEHMLLCTILARALLDISYYPPSPPPTQPKAIRNAEEALAERALAETYFAFRRHYPLCELIGVDPDVVDAWIARMLTWRLIDAPRLPMQGVSTMKESYATT